MIRHTHTPHSTPHPTIVRSHTAADLGGFCVAAAGAARGLASGLAGKGYKAVAATEERGTQ